MKIKLNPVSHPELGTIEIDNNEFLIGRLEEPFISADSEIIRDMSRQHARIFSKNNQYFLIDCGSLNGTKLNGAPVGEESVALKQDDEIEFAKHILFRIDTVNDDLDATVLSQHEDVRLTLEPVDINSGLDILVITGFPFVISKETGVFASFQKQFETEIKQISRRHAYIIVDQSMVKVADMNSTNGTLVNNEKIDNQPRALTDGDIISFGGRFFSYIVKLSLPDLIDHDATVLQEDEPAEDSPEIAVTLQEPDLSKTVAVVAEPEPDRKPEPEPEPEPEPAAIEPRTTYVNDPSPFLDILCEEESAVKADNKGRDASVAEGNETGREQKKPSFFSKATVFLKQLSATMVSDKPGKSRWRPFLVFFSVCLIFAVVGYFYLNDEVYQIQNLIKQEHYEEAARLSNSQLREDPDNTSLRSLSTKAALNIIIPSWEKDIKAGENEKADLAIGAALTEYSANPDIVKSLYLMQWIGKLQRFLIMQQESSQVVIFKNEAEIAGLLDSWEQNKKQNELTLSMIAANVPSFSKFYNEILSNIRTLESEQGTYLEATSELKGLILNKLESNQIEGLQQIVAEFETKYSAVSGLDDLKTDIRNYIEMQDALKSKELERVVNMQKELVFMTPLFENFASRTLTEQLPSDQFIGQYFAAIEAWQTGKIEQAIKTLLGLTENRWGDAAQLKLERFQSVLKEFNVLNESAGTDEYVDRLFYFHAYLNIPEDQYFLNSIENDFQQYKNQAFERVQSNVLKARTDWEKYRVNGGIGGLLRLEDQVSKKYATQAGLLSSAFQNIEYVNRLYKELKVPTPEQVSYLYSSVFEELSKQKKWLKDLELILKPSVLREKLDLLNSSGSRSL